MKMMLKSLTALTLLVLGEADAQAASRWTGLLGGQVLTRVLKDDGSAVTLNGNKIQAGAGSVITELHLCKDGSFLRVQKVTSAGESLNIGNISARASAGSAMMRWTGKWKITQADATSATVRLTPKAGSDELEDDDSELSISFDGANTVVNDARWYRMKSPVCR